MDQVWNKCKEAAKLVLGPLPDEPGSRLGDELATLCTRLASEADRWKTKCSHDSAQEATLLLADNFQEFWSVDVKLREFEPFVAAHKVVLDNWPKYYDQMHE